MKFFTTGNIMTAAVLVAALTCPSAHAGQKEILTSVSIDGAAVRGTASAKFVIVEFSDFQS